MPQSIAFPETMKVPPAPQGIEIVAQVGREFVGVGLIEGRRGADKLKIRKFYVGSDEYDSNKDALKFARQGLDLPCPDTPMGKELVRRLLLSIENATGVTAGDEPYV